MHNRSLEPGVSTMNREAVESNQTVTGYSAPVTPSPEQNISPLSTDPMVFADEEKQQEERGLTLTPIWDYVSSVIFLASFGILGVVTSHLAIGLTTGYLGSLTTFSGWNQKMLDLSVNGHWVNSVVGFLLGLFLVAYSIKFGIATAKIYESFINSRSRGRLHSHWRVNNKSHFLLMTALAMALTAAWISCLTLVIKKGFHKDDGATQLRLACVVAPFGVWTRWFLARRLNGKGGPMKWMQFGTLAANVSAAGIMAALATLKRAVHTDEFNTIASGIQLGFLGCLSTVSTFIAEYNAMEESKHSWRAYVYALTTILLSFALGILIYDVPVWARGYS